MKVSEALIILGLHEPYTLEQVAEAYRTKARDVHPDMGGSAEQFHRVMAARNTLLAKPAMPRHGAPQRKSATSRSKDICSTCDGAGFTVLPSKRLGGQGLRRTCPQCKGTGVL